MSYDICYGFKPQCSIVLKELLAFLVSQCNVGGEFVETIVKSKVLLQKLRCRSYFITLGFSVSSQGMRYMSTAVQSCSGSNLKRSVFLILIAAGLASTTGCAQYLANIIGVFNGPPVPAEFKSLEGKRVAVVASTESGICGDETSIRLAGNMRGILTKKLPKSTFVSQEDVDQWLNHRTPGDNNLNSIGKGVQADYVVSADVKGLRLKDGQTLFQGKSDITCTVTDVKTGKTVFTKSLPQYTYPVMSGQSATETTEDNFRRAYLMVVSDKLSRLFYAHEIGQDFAIDSTILNY
jgi:hypothetical protein